MLEGAARPRDTRIPGRGWPSVCDHSPFHLLRKQNSHSVICCAWHRSVIFVVWQLGAKHPHGCSSCCVSGEQWGRALLTGSSWLKPRGHGLVSHPEVRLGRNPPPRSLGSSRLDDRGPCILAGHQPWPADCLRQWSLFHVPSHFPSLASSIFDL